MADEVPLTRAIVLDLLRSSPQGITEEDRHPWRSNPSVDLTKPLLRTWDKWSGSQPSRQNTMLSRLPRQPLDSWEVRKEFLAKHADHKTRSPTPFISFTQSKADLQENAAYRATRTRRGSQTITVVNPNARVVSGLPILNMELEMRHYGVPDSYERSYEYYRNHYICLWEVTEPEVVGRWRWDELEGDDRWYEDIVMPAFQKHNEEHFIRHEDSGALDMSALLGALSDDTQPLFGNESPGPDGAFCPDWDTSSGEYKVYVEDGYDSYDSDLYDSYDEVLEANATDDMFKIIEGDW